MRYTAAPRNFTKLELLIVLTIITVLLAIVIVVVDRTLANARSQVDARQINTIHKGWLVAAAEIDAVAPPSEPGRPTRQFLARRFLTQSLSKHLLAHDRLGVVPAGKAHQPT